MEAEGIVIEPVNPRYLTTGERVDKVGNLALCLLKDKNMSDGVVTVYGELYGGNIQGGMAYQLEQDFAGFDITVDGTPIDKRKAFSLMNEYEIPTVPVLGVAPSLSDSLETK